MKPTLNVERTVLEEKFLVVYGETVFARIQEFIIENDILDFYLKARKTSRELFDFGFHYGIVEIVAFTYCTLKIPIDINACIKGYYTSIGSSADATDWDAKRPLGMNATPVHTSNDGKCGLVVGTIDKFTPLRVETIRYLIRMQKFSKYRVEKGKFIYTIVDKYIEPYRLLEVY